MILPLLGRVVPCNIRSPVRRSKRFSTYQQGCARRGRRSWPHVWRAGRGGPIGTEPWHAHLMAWNFLGRRMPLLDRELMQKVPRQMAWRGTFPLACNSAVVRHGLFAGGTAFLQKPFAQVALARMVREM